jgi:putative hydrolase of the HAD superfamily
MLTLIRRTRGPDANRYIRPEAVRTIRRAKAAGSRVGILSNKLELFYGCDTMDRLDILKEMDSLIDATHTHILKPDPRAYELGCEALGLSASEVVFRDNQPRNIEGACRAGLETVQFNVTNPALSFAEAETRLGSERPDYHQRVLHEASARKDDVQCHGSYPQNRPIGREQTTA